MLLGLLTLLAGIGQKTIWAPSETFTASVPSDAATAPLTVIDQKLRTLHGGTVKIDVAGDGNFLLAVGRPGDVAAWVGQTRHNVIDGVSEDGTSLQVQTVDGEATAPSPAGSDLWTSTEKASGALEYTWTPPADGEWSLLLASDGTQPAPGSLSMTFPNDMSTPWAVPLMILGAVVVLMGVVLMVLGRHGARRRPAGSDASTAPGDAATDAQTETGSGTAPRLTMAVATLAALVVVGSGTAAYAATPAPTDSPSAEPAAQAEAPVLLDAQFRRILEQVVSATDAGDAAKDASKLTPRVAGTELEVRTQNYKIRSQVGTYEARVPVRAEELLTTAVTTDPAWPRSVMAVSKGEGNVVPQLLTFVQESPRDNYMLMATTLLQPGSTLPTLGTDGVGTQAADDSSGLAYSAKDALNALSDRLSNPDSTLKDKVVEGGSSPYIADTLSYQADTVATGAQATYVFSHTLKTETVQVFRTADGGALALGRLDFTLDGTPKEPGDKLTIGDDAAVLAGGKETTTGMVLTSAETVAVFIPPAGSTDPVKVVAATRGLVGASFK